MINLNGKIKIFLPQSLSKVISSTVDKKYGGVGIPNFETSKCSRKHAIQENAIQAVQTIPILTNIDNVLNVLDVQPIQVKVVQNQDSNVDELQISQNGMIPVLGAPYQKYEISNQQAEEVDRQQQ